MHLPLHKDLPVQHLAACFNKTSATYKYYWLLAVLEEVELGNQTVQKRNLFARMIALAWYTVHYFHISFGKQDLIQEAVRLLKDIEHIPIDEKLQVIIERLSKSTGVETQKQLHHFNKNVPHWFLSPWFPKKNQQAIYRASQSFEEKCLYALYEDRIEVHSEWMPYLVANARVLKDYCYWNLCVYLQAKNPNVPDIPNKLIKPPYRNSLSAQRTAFWDPVLRELDTVPCIYTGTALKVGNYAVEHFIPYNFVSHDLIWNLIPAEKSFNSAKGDKLPPLDKYFDAFYALQASAVEIIRVKAPKNKFLEDYLTIFPDLEAISSVRFRERIQPLITIASNNGFEFLS